MLTANAVDAFAVCFRCVPDCCTAGSISVASKLVLLKTTLNIGGQHRVFDVGLVGVLKANVGAYQVFVCGNALAHKAITLVYRYCVLVRLLLKDRFECAHACCLRVCVGLRNGFV